MATLPCHASAASSLPEPPFLLLITIAAAAAAASAAPTPPITSQRAAFDLCFRSATLGRCSSPAGRGSASTPGSVLATVGWVAAGVASVLLTVGSGAAGMGSVLATVGSVAAGALSRAGALGKVAVTVAGAGASLFASIGAAPLVGLRAGSGVPATGVGKPLAGVLPPCLSSAASTRVSRSAGGS
ncbi:MAG: hypothetical protein DYH12_10970 [Sorangiineae bacterium PRO1]|nr:hypothetical protein [Sorangiineae bacterium PRO1]